MSGILCAKEFGLICDLSPTEQGLVCVLFSRLIRSVQRRSDALKSLRDIRGILKFFFQGESYLIK
jgi:hypothetical protein